MKKTALPSALFAAAIFASGAQATILNFDDSSGNLNPVSGVATANFTWNNFNTITRTESPDSGYTQGNVSPEYVAFNGFADPASVTSNGGLDFMFNEAYFTAAWNIDLNIDIEGWRDGALVHTRTLTVSDIAPTLFAFDWLVDELRFTSYGGVDSGTSGGGAHFAMDNFTYGEQRQNGIPEPTTVALLGLGLAGLGIVRRRKIA